MTMPLPSLGARVARFLALDTTGGALLLAATALALVAANSPLSGAYTALRDVTFGPESLGLHLSTGEWAADGLLAIFFFVVGLELKHEFAVGSLRDPRAAALPIGAAIGGVALPALIFTAVASTAGGDALRGWAIPAATDIAFAVAVLAVVGRRLPPALRTFLLTLAVVDDLLAILIIAVFYSDGIDAGLLLLAVLPLALFAGLLRRRITSWYLLIPLAILTWALVHAAGIHATIAGVALGLVVPAASRPGRAGTNGATSASADVTSAGAASDGAGTGTGTGTEGTHPAGARRPPTEPDLTTRLAERWSPVSSGVAVPVFAFFAAGVGLGSPQELAASLSDPLAVGIIVALLFGKSIGITATTWALTRVPGISLHPSLRWGDIIGMSFVAGIGFTVSLLITELAFGADSPSGIDATIGVLTGSFLAAAIGGTVLAVRGRRRPGARPSP